MAKSLSDSHTFFKVKPAPIESTRSSLELDPKLRPLSLGSFPSEFPYEVDSPVESVLSSTETECSDDDDFFAGLTRRLTQFSMHDSPVQPTQTQSPNLSVPRFASNKAEKMWGVSESPNSTLSGIGSWSGDHETLFTNPNPNPNPTYYGLSQLPSPPMTPFGSGYDTWDLICKAAGEVARLKATSEEKKNYQNTPRHNVLVGNFVLGQGHVTVPQNKPSIFRTGFSAATPTNQYRHVREDDMWKQQYAMLKMQQLQSRIRQNKVLGYENRPCGRSSSVPQSAWSSLQMQQGKNQNQQQTGFCNHKMRAVMLSGSSTTGVKRESTGTGVFLPRTRYGNPPENKRKSGGSTILVPAKVVQALNLNVEDMSNGHSQPRLNNTFVTDHDALMARRNLLIAQQRNLNHEIRLPQEWTY